jgi:hypothetical protein
MNRVDAFLFLARCLAAEDQSAPPGEKLAEEISAGRVSWERVVEIASEYWMTLALYWELGEKRLLGLLPGDLIEYFKTIHEWNSARNREILAHAGELAGLLNQVGVEPLLLKGVSHLASGLYPDPAIRFMDDIDILVPSDRAPECWRFLLSSGYRTLAIYADFPVELIPDERWPPLRRTGRTGELEVHHLSEWHDMTGSPSLYADAAPVTLAGGKACILSATRHMIITLAHGFVQHRYRPEPVPLRDLYDATLLSRQPGGGIAWTQVMEAFERGGQENALRTACMMWRRLFMHGPPCAMDPPRGARIYWQRCLLKISHPRAWAVYYRLGRNIRQLRIALSGTTRGKLARKEFTTASILRHKLRTVARFCGVGRREERWK